MKNSNVFISIAAVTFMAACGGSGSGDSTRGSADPTPNIGAEEDPLRVFSVAAGDVKDVFSDEGDTLHARRVGSSAIFLSYPSDVDPEDGTTALTNADVSILRNSENEFTLVVNGVGHPFENSNRVPDGSGYQIETTDGGLRFYKLLSYTGGIDGYLKSDEFSGYAAAFGYRSNILSEDGPDIVGYAITGTETEDSFVGSLGEVTYNGGRARLDLYPEEGFVTDRELDGRTITTVIFDDVTMTVNLDSSAISGAMGAVLVRFPEDPGYTAIDGAMLMGAAEFDVNAFRGTLTPDATLLENAPSLDVDGAATYSGAFYGPQGDEVAGTLSVKGSGVNGIGYFTAGATDP